MDIEITQKMTLQIGDKTFEITTADAEKLYTKLGIILNKQNTFQLQYPPNTRGWDVTSNYGTVKAV